MSGIPMDEETWWSDYMGFVDMQHIYPINDLREHVTSGKPCWCNPTVDDGVTIHNAMDGREQWETGRKLS